MKKTCVSHKYGGYKRNITGYFFSFYQRQQMLPNSEVWRRRLIVTKYFPLVHYFLTCKRELWHDLDLYKVKMILVLLYSAKYLGQTSYRLKLTTERTDTQTQIILARTTDSLLYRDQKVVGNSIYSEILTHYLLLEL